MAVPRNAAHPNAARLWVDYVLSREVQNLLADLDQQDSHLLVGSKTAQELTQLRGAGVQFAVASVDFVLRQDETEFGRRRARIQQVLAQQ
jgi:ABC-type Fe3+ transport system substrate-binding protein